MPGNAPRSRLPPLLPQHLRSARRSAGGRDPRADGRHRFLLAAAYGCGWNSIPLLGGSALGISQWSSSRKANSAMRYRME